MNSNMLISTGILNTLWEKNRKDTLDLLIPFLKYSIIKNTQIGNQIDIEKVIQYFKDEFGYYDIPRNVVIIMLNRMTSSDLKRYKNNYYLNNYSNDEIQSFEKKRILFKEHSSKVISELTLFLNEYITGQTFNEASVMNLLIDFFVSKGFFIVQRTELLGALKNRDGKIEYAVAQFILNEYKNESEVFDYILEMVKGFFISTAISMQPTSSSSTITSKFHNFHCYLDTSIIINALGLKTNEAHDSAKEMIEMLKNMGAKLYCFEHNYSEIYDIINAYKSCLCNCKTKFPTLTLEKLDELRYTVTDVTRYQKTLRSKIEALGIIIIAKPSYDSITDTSILIDEKGLENKIKSNIIYKNNNAATRDIYSISSIAILRNGLKSTEIEKSGYIFVTSNVPLSHNANDFLCKDKKIYAPLVITDIDLSSILWLKNYSTHKDYPKAKLIENALLSLEPSHDFLSTFFDVVNRIEQEGNITDDEAAIIRTDTFCRRELMEETKGDINLIDKKSILNIRDKLREEYIRDADNKSKLNYDKYMEEKKKREDSAINALYEIEKIGDKWYNYITKILKTVYLIVIVFSFVIFSVMLIYNIINENSTTKNSNYIIIPVAFAIIDFIGFYDIVIGKKKWAMKLISKIAKSISNKKMDKKKSEYEKLLGKFIID